MRKAITVFVVVSILCAVIPFSASATRIDEITQQIRNAQAEAIRKHGLSGGSKVYSESISILQKQIAQKQSADDSKCSEDHNAIAKEFRNKGRVESTIVCVILFAIYVLFEKGVLRMGVLRHIIAIPLGLLAAALVFCLEYIIIEFLGNIPIIGQLFYYPSDSAWALIVLPPSTFAVVAAWVGLKIAKSAKPISVAVFTFWTINLFYMLSLENFAWSEFIMSLIGAGTAIFCFSEL